MKNPVLVVSSVTGNTYKVAQAIIAAYPTMKLARTLDVKNNPALIKDSDTVIVGFWCDKGGLPPDLNELLPLIHDKTLGIFSTMTGDPTSPKAQTWFEAQCQKIVGNEKNNTLKGTFLCRGKLSPILMKQFRQNSAHYTPEREAVWEAAASHPDEKDCQDAVEAFKSIFQ